MRRIATFLFALAFPWPALAQVAEPPGRVGRVAWTQGEVALFADPERDWEKAYVNSPLTTENSLWTEAAARAEVRVGSTALRLEEYTQLDVRRLDDEQLVAHVTRGAIAVRIRHFEPGERYIVSTPFARFHLTGNGRYRVDTDEVTEASRLTVFAGSAQLESSGRRVNVREGEAVFVQSDFGQFDFQRAQATPFDDWSLARDERVQDRETSQYVSPRMTGYEDLERYGSWSQEPDYGAVWYPSSVGDDYVPYSNGNWVHTNPWGWTWVDSAPWGYAPFHYGRWAYINNRWGWCPGGYVRRPVWAPALVGWVGTPGWSVSVGAGRAPVVGWYPLSPRDRYRPWYNNNPRYADRVNNHGRPNDRPGWRPRDDDRNDRGDRNSRERERGTTIVLREGFVNQRPVSNSRVSVPGEVVAAQPVTSGAAVLPSRREAALRKPMQVGPTPSAAVPPLRGVPARGEAAARPESSRAARSPVPRTPDSPAPVAGGPSELSPPRPSTNAPNYRAPVAGTPSAPAPEPRAQSKPMRVAPSSPVPGAPAAIPAPSSRSRQVPNATIQERAPAPPQQQQQQPQQQQQQQQPQPAPQLAKPVARDSTPREPVTEKPERESTPPPAPAPQPAPQQKPMRVQQR